MLRRSRNSTTRIANPMADSAAATVGVLAGVSGAVESPTSGGPGQEALASALRLWDDALDT